jgi:hypothetical protein
VTRLNADRRQACLGESVTQLRPPEAHPSSIQ